MLVYCGRCWFVLLRISISKGQGGAEFLRRTMWFFFSSAVRTDALSVMAEVIRLPDEVRRECGLPVRRYSASTGPTVGKW